MADLIKNPYRRLDGAFIIFFFGVIIFFPDTPKDFLVVLLFSGLGLVHLLEWNSKRKEK